MLTNIQFVLLNTSHPGNIGASARAMKVMGLTDLALVSPKHYPSAEATARASGADDVLFNARVCDDLDTAISMSSLVFGSSSRNRGMNIPVIDVREAAAKIVSASENQRVSVLFGRESVGMSNEEMQRCHYLLRLPANPEYASLNLAPAVQVIAYEIRVAELSNDSESSQSKIHHADYADMEKMNSFYQHLFETLEKLEFLDENNKHSIQEKLRMMFNRLHPEKFEMDILRGILSRINKKIEF
ncbi:MAG: RNA methyltransferase [Proteobacteria bacterium]|nr:RNA methyltransferase [Pseudomonadota bacterium]